MTDGVLPRIAAGDPAAVSDCIARYGGLVWSLARRFLGSPSDAEDAVQDVFIELWKNAGRYDPDRASEPTYVTMIARRRLIDRKRRAARVPGAQPFAEEPPAGEPPVARVEIEDEAAQATAALAELRDEERRVIRLAIYDGLTHEEIAAATGLPVGTVKTHIRRGLIRVRERLAQKGGGA
ncbi:ECF RNA polymerase sigma factor RpoE [Gemmata obscuriglobus]|uniref:RNA polymerase subunit sigma-24 n=1 Tax=Gemmata obscuriglobus TaxID=114 RepID=A0A2Z3HCU5_9BACT|nr:sigma-70 family RNA polymerase sigma factor [Gemmata obscuriglobus]AWM39504.1 RNA polymerase subunit sigma-24 [Gemmata obscuriglobus]QEG27406.1 ECF RNA polymerase sigma factor RpoE [Gemmata obscuriglobus]VTS04329.1 rna sigma-24 ecf subfamily : RNA polymerase, sigma-24 subunit, ECF subfamily OS=Pirellula staleyi (strain ATCC 27377 / DSM 6068 / ICPB 4128) GN=Psta_1180 PE=4 SV=1: Sigma70_r2: Sigma70_r4_2 [Gemmata obscuriglobus UQM 2246]